MNLSQVRFVLKFAGGHEYSAEIDSHPEITPSSRSRTWHRPVRLSDPAERLWPESAPVVTVIFTGVE
jgi:hypothetical protein